MKDDTPIRLRDKRTERRFFIDNTVVDDYGPVIGAFGLAVYMVILKHATPEGENSFPGHPLIAEKTKLCVSTVKKAIKQLESLGLIEIVPRYRKNGGRSSNEYLVLDPPVFRDTGGKVSEVATINPPLDQSSKHIKNAAGVDEPDPNYRIEYYHRDHEFVNNCGKVSSPPWSVVCTECQAPVSIRALDEAYECFCGMREYVLLSKRPNAQVKTHEAILVYRRLTGRTVPEAWRSDVVQDVGTNTDLWHNVVKAYVGLGWNQGNVSNMLKYFNNGEVPKAGGNKRTKKPPQQSSKYAPMENVETQEEIEERRARMVKQWAEEKQGG